MLWLKSGVRSLHLSRYLGLVPRRSNVWFPSSPSVTRFQPSSLWNPWQLVGRDPPLSASPEKPEMQPKGAHSSRTGLRPWESNSLIPALASARREHLIENRLCLFLFLCVFATVVYPRKPFADCSYSLLTPPLQTNALVTEVLWDLCENMEARGKKCCYCKNQILACAHTCLYMFTWSSSYLSDT